MMSEPQTRTAGDGNSGGGAAIATGFPGPDDLGERIAALTRDEAVQLVRYLQAKHSIDARKYVRVDFPLAPQTR
jgi:hypothetical protein